MQARPYCLLSGVVFLIVALAHGWRAATGTALVLGAWSLPIWVSWAIAAGAALLALWGLRTARRG